MYSTGGLSYKNVAYIYNLYFQLSGNIFIIRILVSVTPSWPGWFLTDVLLLLLAGDVVPEPVGPDPGAVLVAVTIIWLSSFEVTEGDRGAVSPGKLSLVKEVRETDPGPG